MSDFITTQTSQPTKEDILAAEKIVGYALPDGANSIIGNSSVEFAVKQILLHPVLFKKLSST